MRRPLWWLFYVVTLGGAIGIFVAATALDDAPAAVWQSLVGVTAVGSAGMIVMMARSKPSR